MRSEERAERPGDRALRRRGGNMRRASSNAMVQNEDEHRPPREAQLERR